MSARTTTRAGRRRTTWAGCTCRRSSARTCKTTFKENIANGPQLEQTVAASSATATRSSSATSFGFFSKKLAAKYPDVLFEQATGTDQAKNLAEYFGAGEDSIYLSGMAAGAATKNGKIGYVVPFAIPEVIRHANAFALGAQAVNPKAQVKLIWTNSWFDPAKEKKAAESLVTLVGRRRARPERRQPGGRASTRSRRGSRGSATTRTRRSSRRRRG